MNTGFALLAHLIESDGWLQFAGIKRASKGYIGMEKERLLNG